jgi:hypothetical protein
MSAAAMNDASPAFDFLGDDELGYVRSRTRFCDGAGLALDDSYRLTHLPLIAPDHPRIIASKPGAIHTMGRHERNFSLVLPVYADQLHQSPAYRALEAELRAAPCGHKIAWDLLPRRQARLHATICNTLSFHEPPKLSDEMRRTLAGIGPITIELRGLFSGNVNIGRLYLPVYPERRHGANPMHAIQRALGWKLTDLYLVGIYNFRDDLDAREAASLKTILEKWQDRLILRYRADHLWMLGTSDTLVLDGAVAESVPLV